VLTRITPGDFGFDTGGLVTEPVRTDGSISEGIDRRALRKSSAFERASAT